MNVTSLRNAFADGIIGLLTSRFEFLNLASGLKWSAKGKGELIVRITPPDDSAYPHFKSVVLEVLRHGRQQASMQAQSRKQGSYINQDHVVQPFSCVHQERIINGCRTLFLSFKPVSSQ